ncbi:hypothetical protein BKA69DRAFT_526436 [Paraphysoderma sedebokerense]|nr:hypothetical protein BKA69DRAFT_526436 [Paraphysoderma sedebokerense]
MQLKFFSRSSSHPELASPTAKPSAAATPKKGNSPKPPLAAAKNASSLASKKKLSSPNAVFPSSHPSPMDVVSSQKTLTDLPTIVESPSTEFDATEDIPKKSITVKGSHSGSTIIDETEIIAEKFKSVSIDDDDTYLSVPPQKNLPPKESDTKKLAKQTSKRSIFKFLKSKSPSSTSIEKTKEKEKSKDAKVKKSVDPPQEPTKESKALKAAEERERRLKEVLAVMEGRKRLPKGMEKYNFTHFIGDGTYGFVVTAVNELDQEVSYNCSLMSWFYIAIRDKFREGETIT